MTRTPTPAARALAAEFLAALASSVDSDFELSWAPGSDAGLQAEFEAVSEHLLTLDCGAPTDEDICNWIVEQQ